MGANCWGMIKQDMQCDLSGHSVDFVFSHVKTRDPSRIPKQLELREIQWKFIFTPVRFNWCVFGLQVFYNKFK